MSDNYFKPWFGHTSPELWEKLKPLAQQKRHEPTPAELKLWHFVRNRKVSGVKFRRQYGIERFIVDFFSVEAQLVIEVDGPIHDYTAEHDAIRQEFIESLGLTVIRFKNEEVLTNIPSVLTQISIELAKPRSPAAPPLHDGEEDGR